VILSRRPHSSWESFFKLRDQIDVPDDFMSNTGRWTIAGARAILMAALHLVDTKIASYIKGTFPSVDRPLGKVPITDVFISYVTEAELRYGLARRPD
jgi:hypothetical protein